MDPMPLLVWVDNKFLGIEWHFWKIVGWAGNLIFFSRFFVQWVASERSKRVVVPPSFWWLSLLGSSCLLAYGLYRRDSVFIFAYLFTWIPYIRNLVIGYRNVNTQARCDQCGLLSPPRAKFCPECGRRLEPVGDSTLTPKDAN